MATVERIIRNGVETSRYRVRYRDDRHSNPKAIGCETETEALEVARRIEAWQRLNPGAPYPRETGGRTGAVPFADAAVAYLLDLARHKADRTIEIHAAALDMYATAHGGDRSTLAALTSTNVEAWDAAAAVAGVAPGTRAGRISVLRSFHRWIWERRGDYPGAGEPRTITRPKLVPARVIAPTWAEMDAMIAECTGSASGYRMAMIARCTGLRFGQIAALTWAHVDLSAGILVVAGGKSASEKAMRREIPIAPVLVDAMRTWTRHGDRVITGEGKGGHAGAAREAIARAWRRAAAAGLVRPDVYQPTERNGRANGCSVHSLRKGFVSGLHRLGADVEAVEYLVGHSNGVRGIRGYYVDAEALGLAKTVALVPALTVPTSNVYVMAAK